MWGREGSQGVVLPPTLPQCHTHTRRSVSFVFIVHLGLIILPNGCLHQRLRTPCGSSVHTVFWSLLKGYVSHMHQTRSIACCTIAALASMCDHYAATSYGICTSAQSLSVIPFDKIYIMQTLADPRTWADAAIIISALVIGPRVGSILWLGAEKLIIRSLKSNSRHDDMGETNLMLKCKTRVLIR